MFLKATLGAQSIIISDFMHNSSNSRTSGFNLNEVIFFKTFSFVLEETPINLKFSIP